MRGCRLNGGGEHVADTAGVGYCVRCDAPLPLPPREVAPWVDPELALDDVPTLADDHLDDDLECVRVRLRPLDVRLGGNA